MKRTAPSMVQELQAKYWKWVGKVSGGNDGCEALYGLVALSADSDKGIKVNICNGMSSLVGNIPNEPDRRESLALLSAISRTTAIRKAFSSKPPLARVEKNELIISIPWGVEYGAGINLDIERVRLRHMQGSSAFLTLLFREIEQSRKELKCLEEKMQHLLKERSDLQRAKKNLEKYLDARPERLRVAAQVLNEFKKTCRLAKGECHGPKENISQN
ncbi:hypothetical protein FGB62_16g39 [Gracilaria domingensis]|nr:hypothetical protein FGB62_16g39 [Gracilaria domingensis]